VLEEILQQTSRRVAGAGMNDLQHGCDEFFSNEMKITRHYERPFKRAIRPGRNQGTPPGKTEVARQSCASMTHAATRQIYSGSLADVGHRA
jgi:hypothetical protein